MQIETKVAGITYRIKNSEEIRTLVPEGEVELVHEPFIHPSDPSQNDINAVKIFNKGLFLGYMGKNSDERKAFFASKRDGIDLKATVIKFMYAHYDMNLNVIDDSFNDTLDGYLASITIGIEINVNNKEYFIKNRSYRRATKISGMVDTLGFIIPKHLYNWMTTTDEKQLTHDEYIEKITKITDKGILMHDVCEAYVKSGIITGDEPHGLVEFCDRYKVKYISSEEVVKQGIKYRVAGRYDLLAEVTIKGETYIVIIDWKSGGRMKLAYALQCSFYTERTKADGFLVVLFGTKNKCGYSVKTFLGSVCNEYSSIFNRLTKISYELSNLGLYKF